MWLLRAQFTPRVTKHTLIKTVRTFFFPRYLILTKRSLSPHHTPFLFFRTLSPRCQRVSHRPRPVCLESQFCPARHGSTSALTGSCVAKGDRKRPLKGRGDRGEGEEGGAELQGKNTQPGRRVESEGGRVQDIDNLECLGGGFVSRPLTVLLNRVD